MSQIDWFYDRGKGCPACTKVNAYLATRGHTVRESVPASRKLQAADCRDLAKQANRLIAMKGKQVNEFDISSSLNEDALNAMLGPTGNMRAPLIRLGKTLLVGYNEGIFDQVMG